MPHFIKLTNVNNIKKTMVVNTDFIIFFQKGDREHTYLKLKDGSYYFVEETVDQIWDMTGENMIDA